MRHDQYSYDAMAGFGAATPACDGYNFADTHSYVCTGDLASCHARDAAGQPIAPGAVTCVKACPSGFKRYVVTSKNDGSVKKWCIRPAVAGAMVAAGHKVRSNGPFGLPGWALPAGAIALGVAFLILRSTSHAPAPAMRYATPNFHAFTDNRKRWKHGKTYKGKSLRYSNERGWTVIHGGRIHVFPSGTLEAAKRFVDRLR